MNWRGGSGGPLFVDASILSDSVLMDFAILQGEVEFRFAA